MKSSGANWSCTQCHVEVSAECLHCQLCLRALPMERKRVPQIFANYVLHFNGIIPRTLKHPSHGAEWRMAERHGAVVTAAFDPQHVTMLIYRPGYERSDKVRLCIEKYTHIPCVPVIWMLDSLLQSRPVHPSLYKLQAIPTVALPTVRGTSLPHHQHPFFVLNVEEYSLYPVDRPQPLTSKWSAEVRPSVVQLKDAPPTRRQEESLWHGVSVWEAAAATCSSTVLASLDEFGEAAETVTRKTSGVEVFKAAQHKSFIDRNLFHGITFILSETLEHSEQVATVLQSCGARLSKTATQGSIVLFHSDDKKGEVMLNLSQHGFLKFAVHTWCEDCLILGELLPLAGPYIPTTKLLQTLHKKREKTKLVE